MKRLPPLSEMERIEQTQLVEKLDEILERIDNEDIGFVITENGLPDMVLIPFRWFFISSTMAARKTFRISRRRVAMGDRERTLRKIRVEVTIPTENQPSEQKQAEARPD